MEKTIGNENMMTFGKKYRVGNFFCVKTAKALSKHKVQELRDKSGIPADVRKHLNRGSLPFILVSTIGGGWTVTFVAGTSMFAFIEHNCTKGDEGINSLHNLFTMMYADTTVFGDQQYWNDKSEALKRFMERTKSDVSKEDDDKELEDMEREQEARAAIVDMAGGVNGGDNGEGK